ncbi:caffeoylshikimate esterase-like isoform X3 [Phalaenopsis equestris]|uniref:caffeoylshikimate esterase-like isoform X3 n=1 Tax=Phalaenopsis equestris TaxID=78828 RepID=UPI0009E295B4|nr:caffeoylshikimate esterase-like isoform X3 [Phalaenopsis equestris]
MAINLPCGQNGVESSNSGLVGDVYQLLSPYRFGLPSLGKKIKGQGTVMGSFTATEPAVMKWEGVDDKLAKMVSKANLDFAPERRRVREAFKDVQLQIDHPLFKMHYSGVQTKEVKAFMFVDGIAKKLATSGYGVFALDYPGYGLSDGLHGYIPSFDSLVDDVAEHFSKVRENPKYQSLPCFLFGQSMGGAVALKVHFKQPHAWDGAVLVAPMCKMGEDVLPPWPLLQLLTGISKIFPKMKLVPPKDIAEMGFKELKKREQASYNVIAYKDKPRLKTACELLKTTQEIECQLAQVSLPLLILHGEADVLTDCSVSEALYEKASSSDKEILIYKDACHSLLEGEPDETINLVLDNILSWLEKRCAKTE